MQVKLVHAEANFLKKFLKKKTFVFDGRIVRAREHSGANFAFFVLTCKFKALCSFQPCDLRLH